MIFRFSSIRRVRGAVQGRQMGGQRLQLSDASFQLVIEPDIVLIAECEKVSFYILVSYQRHEVFSKTGAWTAEHLYALRVDQVLVIFQQCKGSIGRAIIRNV